MALHGIIAPMSWNSHRRVRALRTTHMVIGYMQRIILQREPWDGMRRATHGGGWYIDNLFRNGKFMWTRSFRETHEKGQCFLSTGRAASGRFRDVDEMKEKRRTPFSLLRAGSNGEIIEGVDLRATTSAGCLFA